MGHEVRSLVVKRIAKWTIFILNSNLHRYASRLISNRNNNMIYPAALLGNVEVSLVAWLLAFTKSFASLDIRVVGLLPIKKNQLRDRQATRSTSILKQYNIMFIRKSAVVLMIFSYFYVRLLLIGGALSIKSGRILYFSKKSRGVIWFSTWKCIGHLAIKCNRILWLVRSPDWLIDWLIDWIFVIDLNLLHLWSIITFFYFNRTVFKA